MRNSTTDGRCGFFGGLRCGNWPAEPHASPYSAGRQITPKTSRYTRCSISMLPNVSINGRIRSSGQLGRWWYSINPLPKQRMRPPFHPVRLQPPVIPDPLARRTQQRLVNQPDDDDQPHDAGGSDPSLLAFVALQHIALRSPIRTQMSFHSPGVGTACGRVNGAPNTAAHRNPALRGAAIRPSPFAADCSRWAWAAPVRLPGRNEDLPGPGGGRTDVLGFSDIVEPAIPSPIGGDVGVAFDRDDSLGAPVMYAFDAQ